MTHRFFRSLLYSLPLLLVVNLFWKCQGTSEQSLSEEDKLQLKAARQLYGESMKIHDEVMEAMKEFAPLKKTLQEKADSLQEKKLDAAAILTRIALLDKHKQSMMTWMESIVEVPHYEGDGQNHEGHDHSHHNHNAQNQSPPAEVLKAQQEMKNEIEQLKKDIQQVLGSTKAVVRQ